MVLIRLESFLGYGNGSFTNEMILSTETFIPSLVAVDDFNTDGGQDITVIYSMNDSIQIFLSNGDRTFSDSTM
jgi:hypothetical protein